jgi:hypothetical protein
VSVDPFKSLFERVDPTRGLSDGDVGELLEDAQLLQRIQDQTRDALGRPPRQRRLALISAAAVLVLAGTAAAITLLRSPATNTSQMSCFSQDSLHSKIIVESPYGAHPLETCNAQLHWISVPSSKTPTGLLCVLPNGTVGGFPPSRRFQSCSSIGLFAFNGRVAHPHVLAFERAAQRYFESRACPNVLAARHKILELIGEYGLTGWSVDLVGSRSPSACATFALLTTRHSVHIVGVVEPSQ